MLKLLILFSLILLAQCQTNKCPQFGPYCNCFASQLVVTCDNFTNFSQLNFSSSGGLKIAELELAPLEPAVFDDLNLSGLEIYSQITIRNIKKFVFNSNPFESARKENKIRLNLNDVTLKFDLILNKDLNDNCSIDSIDASFKPIFASFDYILFGDNIDYSNYICPLVFLNVNTRIIEMVNIVEDKRLTFKKLKNSAFVENILNNNIQYLKVYDAKNLILDNEFLNEDVFYNTNTIEIDNSNLKRIKDDTFNNLFHMKKLIINIENMEEFLTSSTNRWMFGLNSDILVNTNDDEQIKQNENETFVLILNNRIKEQNYLYPSEHLKYFSHFPHEKLVFPRILTKMNLNRTKTLDFLLKNWRTANKTNKLAELNTTSTRLVLSELLNEPEPSVESSLTEAQIISIVYAISFALIFIDWLVYKFTQNVHIKQKLKQKMKNKKNRVAPSELKKKFPFISTISRRQTVF